ncbi:hypothetical protein [Streptomyces sp. ST1015]|uniref:hypothetical protein n=1 Tax=Streptomyces sp. ST1015 TaxID=1848900 RepID=UPI001CA69803|nr:hypothetical protein [Streptomyces sp. ST1015]QZZ30687.1 hypothetical protein A7X85_34650 [Streptomyces sp. ST1015]
MFPGSGEGSVECEGLVESAGSPEFPVDEPWPETASLTVVPPPPLNVLPDASS